MDLEELIAQVEPSRIAGVLEAVIDRYAQLFPEWQICTVSLRKGNDRDEQLDSMISMLESLRNSTAHSAVIYHFHPPGM